MALTAAHPIILDAGSGRFKCGLAGDELPGAVFPSIVGRVKNVVLSLSSMDAFKDVYVGEEVQSVRALLRVRYPVEHGMVSHWDGVEELFKHSFSVLGVLAEEHPVFLTDPPRNSRSDRERTTSLMFETFHVPAFHLGPQSSYELYATGRTSGVVLESGDGVSHVAVVHEGQLQLSSRLSLSGRDVTQYLQNLLSDRGYDRVRRVVQDVKEKYCYVEMNVEEAMTRSDATDEVDMSYELPDGQRVDATIGSERFRAPEILFSPPLVGLSAPGISEMVHYTISQSHEDADLQALFFQNIILAGGSTCFKGMDERLKLDVTELAPSNVEVNVFGSDVSRRKDLGWIGASMMAGNESFESRWITRSEYEDVGPGIVHRKCV